MNPRFPRLEPGDDFGVILPDGTWALDAPAVARFNAVRRELNRLRKWHVQAPLTLSDTAAGIGLGAHIPRGLFVLLSGAGPTYTGAETIPTTGGSWVAGPRTGLTVYEVNGITSLSGKRLWVEPDGFNAYRGQSIRYGANTHTVACCSGNWPNTLSLTDSFYGACTLTWDSVNHWYLGCKIVSGCTWLGPFPQCINTPGSFAITYKLNCPNVGGWILTISAIGRGAVLCNGSGCAQAPLPNTTCGQVANGGAGEVNLFIQMNQKISCTRPFMISWDLDTEANSFCGSLYNSPPNCTGGPFGITLTVTEP